MSRLLRPLLTFAVLSAAAPAAAGIVSRFRSRDAAVEVPVTATNSSGTRRVENKRLRLRR